MEIYGKTLRADMAGLGKYCMVQGRVTGGRKI